ncbi:MAG: hypothetical protein M0Q91_05875 [Methanoregula sp.]|jgi:hypothetical protein|nr:hypothetical protein [Methanoregula sp.]
MEPVISESELAVFRFNYESTWKQCVTLVREGKLRVVADTEPYKFLSENMDKNTSGDSCVS